MDFVLKRLYIEDEVILDKRGKTYTCGRGKENEIVCLSLLVSRKHCIFFHDTERLFITDLQSSNGIFINGMVQRPYQMIELHENDIVGIGCSDIKPNEPALFVYKICELKSSSPAEEVDSSLLSKTVLNCETSQKQSISTKCTSRKECRINTTGCDMAVPCNISRDNNEHMSNVSPSAGINSRISCGNQNPHDDISYNVVEKGSNSDTDENDVKIVLVSCKKQTKDQKVERNLKSERFLTKIKSDCDDKEFQHSKKLQIGNHKTTEKTNMPINKRDKNGINSDNKKINKMDIVKEISNDVNETNSTAHTTIKESNSIHNNNQIIKQENESEESEMTDDDEKAHLAAAGNKMSCDTSPIKLKKIKTEPTTRFSEVDVVDLSDDEDGIFPYSQLFDIKFDDKTKNKVEIKQECISNDSEKVDLLDDEVVILSDSEDEDNPWLHRLSRSQLINENKESKMGDVIIKNEIDLGIWEDDDISNIINSSIPSTSKDAKNIIDMQTTSDDASIASVHKETSLALCTSISDNIKSEEDTIANLPMTETNMMDIDDIAYSDEPSRNIDHTNRQKTNVKEDADKQVKSNEISPQTGMKERTIKSVTTNKRLIPVIEPPHIPPKRRRFYNDPNKDCSKQHSKDHSVDNNKTSISPKKKPSKLTIQEDNMLKLKAKLDSNFYKEQKDRKEPSKKAADCSLSSKAKLITPISKEEKKIIVEERKMKLKKIAEEKKERSLPDGDKTIKRTAKPRAKISLKNRGDFLINDQEMHVSKQPSNKEQAKSNSNKSMKQLIDRIDKLKESEASNIEMEKSHKEQNNSRNSINNVVTSLQQSLNLNNAPDIIQTFNKDGSTKDLNITNNAERKRINKKKKSNVTETNETISELQEMSTKRTSILVKKDDSSSNNTKSKLVAKLKKKKVSFSEKLDIKEYEIDSHNSLKRLEGKDAPIPTNKLKINHTQNISMWKPKLEEFLLCIFMWNPVWLEEQRYLGKSEPPIVKEDALQPMKLRYDSFQHYYKIAQPLLLHEIWHVITKDFDNLTNNMQHVTAMCYIVANSIMRTPISSTNSFLTTLMIEVLVRKEDLYKRTHPKYGDLVSFEYVREGKTSSKQKFQKLFAYIINMHQTVITDFTHFNKDLKNYVKNPYAVITYTMLTRPLDNDTIMFNRVQRVRTITYLRASIRMVQALQYLPESPLSRSIWNPKVEDYQLPPMDASYTCSSLVTKDKLNPKQLEAVFRVTQAVLKKESKLCFIQGPPGTGKSKVIVNLVSQMLYTENESKNAEKFRILICAPSNAAIDEIVTRLLLFRSTLKTKRFNMVRIGRPETMHPLAKDISVTELARRYIKKVADKGVQLFYNGTNSAIRDEKAQLEAQINSFQKQLANVTDMSDTQKKEIKRKLMDVSIRYQILLCGKSIDQINPQDRSRFQRGAEDTILAGADIVACTLSSCYTKQMESIFGINKQSLSVCIVDEATQSCEAETLIPLMLGVRTLVLVGDPNQLPATILSQKAKKLGLDQSIFSRIQHAFTSLTNNPIIMLDTQYRMAYSISYWPNKYFYGGRLKNAVENRLAFPFHPYRVLNHNFMQNSDKFTNTTEAEFVANIIYAMLIFAKWENINEPLSLGILTPYNGQRNVVLNKIQEKISTIPDNTRKRINYEVNTVDSFQGQERDIIIMACVRSNGIGFLSDKQRLCVALTRAKHSLILCGNFNTFMKDQMWNVLLSDARSRGVLCNIDINTPANIKKFIIS